MKLKTFEPVLLVGTEKFANVDIRVRVKGGGTTAQIYAIRQAIAKGNIITITITIGNIMLLLS